MSFFWRADGRWGKEAGEGGAACPREGGLAPGFGQVVALGAQQKYWSWRQRPDLAEAMVVLRYLPIPLHLFLPAQMCPYIPSF